METEQVQFWFYIFGIYVTNDVDSIWGSFMTFILWLLYLNIASLIFYWTFFHKQYYTQNMI